MTAPTSFVPHGAAALTAIDTWRAEHGDNGHRLVATLTVDGDDPNLRGHFPGQPILPGVFVIEALTQLITAFAGRGGRDGPTAALRVLHSARFLAPLLAGDQLTLTAEVQPADHSGWRVSAEGRRRDGTVCARIRADFDERTR